MFETPDFEFDDFTPEQPRNSHGRLPGDEGLKVKFYKRAVQNKDKSNIEGRKIFEEHEFVQIHIPGDQYNHIDTFVTPEYVARFPKDYEHFVAKTTASVVGTPVQHMPGVSISQAAEYRSLNIHTVEDLADLPDTTRIPGLQEMKRKAKAYLDVKREESISLRAEETTNLLKKHELEAAEHKAQIAALNEQVAQLLKASSKKNKDSEA